MSDVTIYSQTVEGDKGNYSWSVRFDKTRSKKHTHEPGYIGISQFEGGKMQERVLLSPTQAKELVEFISRTQRNP